MSALTARLELSSSARVVLATLLVAAGAIHLAMVPSHASASTSEGLTFAAVGSVQLLLGVVVAQRASWLVLGAAALVSLASIGAWVVSRTAGLPYGAHEGVAEAATTVDVTTVVLEFLAVVVVAVLAFVPTMGDTWSRGAVALTSTIPVLVLVFAANALASPGALDHGNSERVAAASGDVHDHGIDSAAAPAVTPVAAAPEPPLDESGQRTLDQQLDTVRALIARYPTVASAKAAGMYDATSPAHGPPWYFVAPANQRFASDPGFDLEHPLVFLYAGRSDVSPVVGVAYYEFAERGPRGFAGPDDTWALQRGLCSVANRGGGSQIVSIDVDITPSECEAMDGTYADSVQWVLNTWVAPGWENTAGVFSKENPRLSCVIEAYVQWLGTAKGTGAAPGPEATAALADDLQACGRPAS